MARLAVLTDRLPGDRDLKGAYAWEIIRALAESQHEVTVFTTHDPERIDVSHPRLNVARPANAFTVDKMPRWTQALLTCRPEVIHTFAPAARTAWPKFTVWPYLDAVCRVLPGMKRVSTMFDAQDFAATNPAHAWHLGSDTWTLFAPAQESAARSVFQGRIEVVPLDEPLALERDEDGERGFTFVPAPVSEWARPLASLARLAQYLRENPGTNVVVNGGWGDLPLSQRRQGWALMMDVATRVRLLESLPLARFHAHVARAASVWVEGLDPRSWRRLVSERTAQNLGKPLIGSPLATPELDGSTVNFISRLYLS